MLAAGSCRSARGGPRDIALLDAMTGAAICLGLHGDAGLRRLVVNTIRDMQRFAGVVASGDRPTPDVP